VNRPGLLADVLAEPAALDALAAACAAPEGPLVALPDPDGVERVLLVGMGSSRYAARTAATALRHVAFPDAADDGVAAHAEVSALELLAHELWRRQEETP
jgi:fructoselysine-6-P-deglycase FrlB-like protein